MLRLGEDALSVCKLGLVLELLGNVVMNKHIALRGLVPRIASASERRWFVDAGGEVQLQIHGGVDDDGMHAVSACDNVGDPLASFETPSLGLGM